MEDGIFSAEKGFEARAAPELQLTRRNIYGRETIIPDDVAIRAARGQSPLQFRLYVKGDRQGWRTAGREELIADIDAEWARRSLDGDQSGAGKPW